jgi:hypothetical protein
MPLPPFVPGNEGFDVLPPGRHTVTSDDVRKAFITGRPDEAHREGLWTDFEDFCAGLVAQGLHPISYWIDGSFISAKVGPKDIDITPVLDFAKSTPSAEAKWFSMQAGPRWQTTQHPVLGRTLMLDIYPLVKLPDGHPDLRLYLVGRGKWDDWWQRCRATGEEMSKGFVEVLA